MLPIHACSSWEQPGLCEGLYSQVLPWSLPSASPGGWSRTRAEPRQAGEQGELADEECPGVAVEGSPLCVPPVTEGGRETACAPGPRTSKEGLGMERQGRSLTGPSPCF